MSAPVTPVDPEGFNPEWATYVLREWFVKSERNPDNLKVNKVEAVLNGQQGLLSTTYAVEVYYQENGQEEEKKSIFVKVPLTGEASKNFKQVNVREYEMFTNVLPELQNYLEKHCTGFFCMGVPEIIHCHYSGDETHDAFILENLVDAGYVTCATQDLHVDKTGKDYLRSTLETLAQLHGTGLHFKREQGGNNGILKKFPKIEEQIQIKDILSCKESRIFLRKYFCPFIRYLEETDPDLKNITSYLKKMETYIFKILNVLEDSGVGNLNTLCHGDAKPNNFMFRKIDIDFEDEEFADLKCEGVESMLIDWQGGFLGSLCNDLMWCVFPFLEVNSHDPELANLAFQHYFDELKNVLDTFGAKLKDFGLPETQAEFRSLLRRGFVLEFLIVTILRPVMNIENPNEILQWYKKLMKYDKAKEKGGLRSFLAGKRPKLPPTESVFQNPRYLEFLQFYFKVGTALGAFQEMGLIYFELMKDTMFGENKIDGFEDDIKPKPKKFTKDWLKNLLNFSCTKVEDGGSEIDVYNKTDLDVKSNMKEDEISECESENNKNPKTTDYFEGVKENLYEIVTPPRNEEENIPTEEGAIADVAEEESEREEKEPTPDPLRTLAAQLHAKFTDYKQNFAQLNNYMDEHLVCEDEKAFKDNIKIDDNIPLHASKEQLDTEYQNTTVNKNEEPIDDRLSQEEEIKLVKQMSKEDAWSHVISGVMREKRSISRQTSKENDHSLLTSIKEQQYSTIQISEDNTILKDTNENGAINKIEVQKGQPTSIANFDSNENTTKIKSDLVEEVDQSLKSMSKDIDVSEMRVLETIEFASLASYNKEFKESVSTESSTNDDSVKTEIYIGNNEEIYNEYESQNLKTQSTDNYIETIMEESIHEGQIKNHEESRNENCEQDKMEPVTETKNSILAWLKLSCKEETKAGENDKTEEYVPLSFDDTDNKTKPPQCEETITDYKPFPLDELDNYENFNTDLDKCKTKILDHKPFKLDGLDKFENMERKESKCEIMVKNVKPLTFNDLENVVIINKKQDICEAKIFDFIPFPLEEIEKVNNLETEQNKFEETLKDYKSCSLDDLLTPANFKTEQHDCEEKILDYTPFPLEDLEKVNNFETEQDKFEETVRDYKSCSLDDLVKSENLKTDQDECREEIIDYIPFPLEEIGKYNYLKTNQNKYEEQVRDYNFFVLDDLVKSENVKTEQDVCEKKILDYIPIPLEEQENENYFKTKQDKVEETVVDYKSFSLNDVAKSEKVKTEQDECEEKLLDYIPIPLEEQEKVDDLKKKVDNLDKTGRDSTLFPFNYLENSKDEPANGDKLKDDEGKETVSDQKPISLDERTDLEKTGAKKEKEELSIKNIDKKGNIEPDPLYLKEMLTTSSETRDNISKYLTIKHDEEVKTIANSKSSLLHDEDTFKERNFTPKIQKENFTNITSTLFPGDEDIELTVNEGKCEDDEKAMEKDSHLTLGEKEQIKRFEGTPIHDANSFDKNKPYLFQETKNKLKNDIHTIDIENIPLPTNMYTTIEKNNAHEATTEISNISLMWADMKKGKQVESNPIDDTNTIFNDISNPEKNKEFKEEKSESTQGECVLPKENSTLIMANFKNIKNEEKECSELPNIGIDNLEIKYGDIQEKVQTEQYDENPNLNLHSNEQEMVELEVSKDRDLSEAFISKVPSENNIANNDTGPSDISLSKFSNKTNLSSFESPTVHATIDNTPTVPLQDSEEIMLSKLQVQDKVELTNTTSPKLSSEQIFKSLEPQNTSNENKDFGEICAEDVEEIINDKKGSIKIVFDVEDALPLPLDNKYLKTESLNKKESVDNHKAEFPSQLKTEKEMSSHNGEDENCFHVKKSVPITTTDIRFKEDKLETYQMGCFKDDNNENSVKDKPERNCDNGDIFVQPKDVHCSLNIIKQKDTMIKKYLTSIDNANEKDNSYLEKSNKCIKEYENDDDKTDFITKYEETYYSEIKSNNNTSVCQEDEDFKYIKSESKYSKQEERFTEPGFDTEKKVERVFKENESNDSESDDTTETPEDLPDLTEEEEIIKCQIINSLEKMSSKMSSIKRRKHKVKSNNNDEEMDLRRTSREVFDSVVVAIDEEPKCSRKKDDNQEVVQSRKLVDKSNIDMVLDLINAKSKDSDEDKDETFNTSNDTFEYGQTSGSNTLKRNWQKSQNSKKKRKSKHLL